MNIKLIFLIFILIISIGVLFDIFSKKDTLKKEIVLKKDVKKNKSKKLILFWANWCGLCVKTKPNWEKAKELIKKRKLIEVIDINCDDYNDSKCTMMSNGKKIGLEGVPTIVIRDDNNDVEYERGGDIKGDRSPEDILKFVNKNL